MDLSLILQEEDDLAFEDELSRDPYSVKAWTQYIHSKRNGPAAARNLLYERAVRYVPGSYKLWHAYLQDRVQQVRGLSVTDPALEAVNATFERALVFMHKMPVIWCEYCSFLAEQRLITRTRRAFDRALQSLPITQHHLVWPLFTAFAKEAGVRETCVRVYRRYLMFDPSAREEYVDYLVSIEHYDEAAAQIAAALNDEAWVSPTGRSKHALWMLLCDVVCRHPGAITSLRVDPILRSGIRKFSDEVGRLWCALAEYYVRLGLFEAARDVYEEAMAAVSTVRDFATIFDAYACFEEAMLTAKLEVVARTGASAAAGARAPASGAAPSHTRAAGVVHSAADLDDLSLLQEAGDDVDLRMARLEVLLERRPLLLSAVLLRQNPHNVHEWVKRARLLQEGGASATKVIATFEEGVAAVNPWQAVGRPQNLWAEFAKYHEGRGELEAARAVFRRGSSAAFKSPEDLAVLWCEWAEMEIRHEAYAAALQLMEEATTPPRSMANSRAAAAAAAAVGAGADAAASQHLATKDAIRARLHRSQRLWGLYLDLEESLGTVASVKAAYDRCITLKVASPAMVLNYAAYLEERNYFEDSFRAYERGVAAFPWPPVQEVWLAYLTKFVQRYGGSKLERGRDLFEQALADCPPTHAATIYRMYAEMEEQYGLVRHAMAVYDRGCRAVDPRSKYELYLTYLRKAEQFFGAPRTREIYEAAVEALPDAQVKDMCLRFAKMETKLGEVDRARAIYTHAAQYCDPRTALEFWSTWQEFEVSHGDEDSFRDMLRVKRSVGATFATTTNMVADILRKTTTTSGAEGSAPAAGGGAGAAAPVPPPAAPLAGTKRAAPVLPIVAIAPALRSSSAAAASRDAAEIDLDADDAPATHAVPAAVFGGLAKQQ